MRRNNDSSLFETAREYLPGGTLGILTLPNGFKFIAASGSGAYVYDTKGERYVDYLIGSGSVLLGHCHPAVVEAVTRQVQKGTNFYVENDKAIALAKEVVTAIPCADKVRFVSSGSEANSYAVRLARAYTGKDLILKFEGSYHGFQDYAMVSSQFANPKNVKSFPKVSVDSAGIPKAVAKTLIAAPFNDIETTRRIINRYEKRLAGVIIEPLHRTIAPKPGFLQELREMTTAKNIPLIFDEVVTGFRLAYGGAQEYYGVVPEIACVGKSFSGGLPLAAVCGMEEIMDALDPQNGYYGSTSDRRVFMTGTFNGNALSCAAGLATLRELRKPGTYDALNSYGSKLRERMREVFSENGVVAQVHGDGAVSSFTFTDKEVVDFRSEATGNGKMKEDVTYGLLKRSVFAPYKLYSSVAHTSRELELTVSALDETIKSLNPMKVTA
jgi:glutamate-1-semialdehyde 2,1-aminomutase